MCEKAVEKDPRSLQFVPHWFVTQQVKPWHNDDLIKWYEGYQKRKAQKAQMKEDLMPIVWHLSRWWVSCVPDDEKKRDRIFFFFFLPLDMLRLKMYLVKRRLQRKTFMDKDK